MYSSSLACGRSFLRSSTWAVLALLLLGGGPAFAQQDPALLNVSTRGQVGSGDDVMIAGFIIDGTAPRRVLIRALGPLLGDFGVKGVLANPSVSLVAADKTVLATNDDWQSEAAAAATMKAIGLAPPYPTEAAILQTLQPGVYTAIVRGTNNSTGIGLVEVYDLDTRDNSGVTASRTLNMSTRGRVGVGDGVMIMGFIIGGTAPRNILVTAIAGSLAEYGLNDSLPDSKVQIFQGQTMIAESDDWIDSPDFESIARTGASPRDPLEAAVYLHLQPGPYTAVVSGANGEQGVALPEVNDVRSLRDVNFAPASLVDRTGKLAITTGGPAEAVNIAFIGTGTATVNTGAAGTYTYRPTTGFKADVNITASGYTLTGTLQFYRDKIGAFSGSLTKPGAAKMEAGGVLVLQ